MILVYKDSGKPVRLGDQGKDWRGDPYTVVGMREPRHTGSTGRVVLDYKGDGGSFSHGYYPSVIGAEWVPHLPKVKEPK